jgi:hypothetical protein
MNRALRVGGALALLAALAAWVLWVAVITDFNEAAVLLQGGLWFLIALTLTWRPRWRVLPIAVIAVLGVAMIVVGLLARSAAAYQQEVRRVVTQNVLEATARSLRTHLERGGTLPDGNWEQLIPLLVSLQLWPELVMPYEGGGGRAERLAHMPRKDEWGCKYSYAKTGDRQFTLKSSGADRRWDTPDDLVVRGDSPLTEGPRPLPVYPRARRR